MKSNIGLVEYAKAQLGRPYWMGTFGQTATEQLYQYNKGRLPMYYTATDFPSQYGQRVHDCIGLIKGYLWSEDLDAPPRYNAAQDVDADSMLRLCKEKGPMGTIPELPGVLVFYPGHVGVYIGDGQVIEARGHAYGVVQTRLYDRGWNSWGKCPYVTYEEDDMSYDQFKEYMTRYEAERAALPPGTWGVDAKAWAEGSGILRGDADGRMRYKSPMTREEYAIAEYRQVAAE